METRYACSACRRSFPADAVYDNDGTFICHSCHANQTNGGDELAQLATTASTSSFRRRNAPQGIGTNSGTFKVLLVTLVLILVGGIGLFVFIGHDQEDQIRRIAANEDHNRQEDERANEKAAQDAAEAIRPPLGKHPLPRFIADGQLADDEPTGLFFGELELKDCREIPGDLNFKAKVVNETGRDVDSVKLVLSVYDKSDHFMGSGDCYLSKQRRGATVTVSGIVDIAEMTRPGAVGRNNGFRMSDVGRTNFWVNGGIYFKGTYDRWPGDP